MNPINSTSSTDPPVETKPGLFSNLRNKFLTGLAFAIPLIATFMIIGAVFNILQTVSKPLTDTFVGAVNAIFGLEAHPLSEESFQIVFGYTVIKPISLIIPTFVLIALGTMLKYVLGRRIADFTESLLLRIPIVKAIYKTVKQTMDAFKSFGGGGKSNFKRVVYLKTGAGPHQQIGFVTGHYLEPKTGKAMTTVFIPFALTPYTGFIYVVEDNQVTDSGLTMEEAMKLIFSGGLVSPVAATASSMMEPHPKVENITSRVKLRTPWGTSTEPAKNENEDDTKDGGASDVPGEIVTLPDKAKQGKGIKSFFTGWLQ